MNSSSCEIVLNFTYVFEQHFGKRVWILIGEGDNCVSEFWRKTDLRMYTSKILQRNGFISNVEMRMS